MNLERSPEQNALAQSMRAFLAAHDGGARALLDDPRGTTDARWQGLAALGATGLLVSPEYGGSAATMVDAGIIAEALGAALDSGPWLSCAAACRALARFGAEAAGAQLLAAIADGTGVATVGPLGGAGVAPVGDGPNLLLRGRIDRLDDAAAADVALISVRDDPGWTLYSVRTADLVLMAIPLMDKTRRSFRAHLPDVPARVLGRADDGAAAALADDVAALAAADAIGAAQRLLEMTLEHAGNRRQFGAPIGSFQSVQQLCVSMYQIVELGRGGVLRALWAADEGDADQRWLAAARLRAFGDRLATVGDTAIQVFGGIGYTWEHNAHLYLRRLLGYSTMLGTSDQGLEQVGAALVASCRRAGRPGRAMPR